MEMEEAEGRLKQLRAAIIIAAGLIVLVIFAIRHRAPAAESSASTLTTADGGGAASHGVAPVVIQRTVYADGGEDAPNNGPGGEIGSGGAANGSTSSSGDSGSGAVNGGDNPLEKDADRGGQGGTVGSAAAPWYQQYLHAGAGGGAYYTPRPGETLADIAHEFHLMGDGVAAEYYNANNAYLKDIPHGGSAPLGQRLGAIDPTGDVWIPVSDIDPSAKQLG